MDVRRQIIVSMASVAIAYASGAHGIGLGEIQLNSALHQPFDATIVLHGTDGLAPSDIVVSLADASEFTRIGIDRSHFLTLLRFTPVLQGKNLVVQVRSSGPVVEPYLNFLIQLKRPHGTLLREYTVLLDPPLYQPAGIATAIPMVTAVQNSDTALASQRTQPAERQQLELPQLQPDPQALHYRSQSGDNLWAIAKATRTDASIPVRRQMLAIRALNPDAFVNGDMDRLRADQSLVLPTTGQMGGELIPARGTASPTKSLAVDTAAVSNPVEAKGRLRIAEQEDAPFPENAELQQRLTTLESSFSELLEELNSRDRQVASLQAELEILRQTRDAELESASAGVAQGSSENNTEDSAQSAPVSNYEPLAGGLVSELPQLSELAEAPSEPQPFSMLSWWPALLTLLAVIVGVIVFRLGRGRNDDVQTADVLPVSANALPARRSLDALEGAEMYLAYGRYAEARRLLEKAIRVEPQRLDLRLCQLAVLAQLGDRSAFTTQELEARQLGADAAQLAELKAQLISTNEQSAVDDPAYLPEHTESVAEPIRESEVEGLQGALLEQDDFSLDPDWSLLDDLDPSSTRRQARAVDDQVDEAFETNLNDYPEVGELDDELSEHFADSKRKLSDN